MPARRAPSYRLALPVRKKMRSSRIATDRDVRTVPPSGARWRAGENRPKSNPRESDHASAGSQRPKNSWRRNTLHAPRFPQPSAAAPESQVSQPKGTGDIPAPTAQSGRSRVKNSPQCHSNHTPSASHATTCRAGSPERDRGQEHARSCQRPHRSAPVREELHLGNRMHRLTQHRARSHSRSLPAHRDGHLERKAHCRD